MCDCIEVSDPAHPQFWHYCLPNEEPIEKPKDYFWESQKKQKTKKNQSIFQKKNSA